MKTTQNKNVISLLVRFTKLKQSIKVLSDEEYAIKQHVKDLMHEYDTKVLIAGEYAAVLTDRARFDLDKEILRELLGDSLKHALKKVDYEIFEVKKS